VVPWGNMVVEGDRRPGVVVAVGGGLKVQKGGGGVAKVFVGRQCGSIFRLLRQRVALQQESAKLSAALEKLEGIEGKDVTHVAASSFGTHREDEVEEEVEEKEEKETRELTRVNSCDTQAPSHHVCGAHMGAEAEGRALGETVNAKLTKVDKLKNKLAKAEAKLAAIDVKVHAAAGDGTLDAVCAFVIFNSQEAQRDCIGHYSSAAWAWGASSLPVRGTTLFGLEAPLFLLNWFQRPELKFTSRTGKSYGMRVSRAPEPTNILWENLEVSRVQGFLRRNVSGLMTFLIILISFAVIVFAKSIRSPLTL